MFVIFAWLAHWYAPINAFRNPYGVERTEGSSYRLLHLFHKTDSHNSKSKHNIVYPNTPDDSPPIPMPPQQWTLHEEEPTNTSPENESGPSSSNLPEITVLHLVSQSELNDLVRDLNFSKIQAELLASRLQR
jgi:hypothetical protein